jgi:hypothetical protein
VGLEIVLQTEVGACVDSVADPGNYLGKLLQEKDGDKYPMLGGIDPYGDTIFNGIQIRRFLSEWPQVAAKAGTLEERQLFSKIEELSRRCRDGIHLYIRFADD